MTCDLALLWMQYELDGELGRKERFLLHEHILSCSECETIYERLHTLSDHLENLPNVTPPFSIVNSILPQIMIMEAEKEMESKEELSYEKEMETSLASPNDMVSLRRSKKKEKQNQSALYVKRYGGLLAASILMAVLWFNNGEEGKTPSPSSVALNEGKVDISNTIGDSNFEPNSNELAFVSSEGEKGENKGGEPSLEQPLVSSNEVEKKAEGKEVATVKNEIQPKPKPSIKEENKKNTNSSEEKRTIVTIGKVGEVGDSIQGMEDIGRSANKGVLGIQRIDTEKQEEDINPTDTPVTFYEVLSPNGLYVAVESNHHVVIKKRGSNDSVLTSMEWGEAYQLEQLKWTEEGKVVYTLSSDKEENEKAFETWEMDIQNQTVTSIK